MNTIKLQLFKDDDSEEYVKRVTELLLLLGYDLEVSNWIIGYTGVHWYKADHPRPAEIYYTFDELFDNLVCYPDDIQTFVVR